MILTSISVPSFSIDSQLKHCFAASEIGGKANGETNLCVCRIVLNTTVGRLVHEKEL